MSKLKNQEEYMLEIDRLRRKVSELLIEKPPIIQKEIVTVEKPVEVEKIIEVVREVPVETIYREKVPPRQPIVV